MTDESAKKDKLIEELLKKLDAERQANSRLKSEIAQYKNPKKMAKSYEQKLEEKDKVIAEKDKLINELQQNMEWLRRKVWGQMSESHRQYDPSQLSIDFGDRTLTPEEVEAYKSAKAEAEAYYNARKTAAKKRMENDKPSRNPLPENLKRVEEHVYPDGYNPDEWDLLPSEFDEITEVLERYPSEYYVRRIVRHKAIRKSDKDRHIICPPVPAVPVPKSYGGATVLANLMVGKYVDGLPFYRQIEMMKRQGISIPPATINNWFLDVADLLRPLYYRIQELVMESDYVQVDETTVPIVRDEKHKTVKGYLWQSRAVLLNLLFFYYDKGSRSQDVARKLLANFKGALQTDGYAVYDEYAKKSGILSMVCLAHARRCFDRSLNNDEQRSRYALSQFALLYEIERKADDEGMDYDQRKKLRQELSLPILRAFEAWLISEKPKVMPKSPIGKAIDFCLNRFGRLCAYTVDGRYRIDSNLVENTQRPVALTRKNYLFCKNDDAAEDAAVIYTVMGCCKAVGVNMYDWLVYFLNHVHEYDNDYSRDLAELLPERIKDKLQTQ